MRDEPLRRPKSIKIGTDDVQNAFGGVFKARRLSERWPGAPPASSGQFMDPVLGNIELFESILGARRIRKGSQTFHF